MCGICGIVQKVPTSLGGHVRAMNRAQAHRGPDGEGFFVGTETPRVSFADTPMLDEPAVCVMGHRRLAIIDPEGGAQPIASDDGQVTVLLNGEIYNFPELRRDLEKDGFPFRTDTDTEVLLHLYRKTPDDPASWLCSLNGIFALAIWDHRQKRLLLARDHYGVKPLHVSAFREGIAFSSEIKSLLAAGVKPRLNRASLHAFMNVRYVPGNDTLFDGVSRLPPAHFAWVREGKLDRPIPFYSLPGRSAPTSAPRAQLLRETGAHFQEAVDRQLISDVPVGMALSGGLDSSMIVAAASSSYANNPNLRTADRTLRTFTLGFNEPTDENDDAKIVAEHFKTEHHDNKLAIDTLQASRDVIRAVEEPKINMIQGYALARMVAPHVKVLFSGLGGDELFAGYDIHRYCNTLGKLNGIVPPLVERTLLRPMSSLLWKLQSCSGVLKTEHYRIGSQILLSAGDRSAFYTRLRNAWDHDSGMYKRVYSNPDSFKDLPRTASHFERFFEDGNYLEEVLRAEFQTKMVNDFLVNEDRVTSAHGVEGRVPFLDRNLVEYAFQLEAPLKMRGRETKALWKDSVHSVLPERIIRKKKQGFTFSSYHQWEKDLREEVEKELTREWCMETGLFNHEFVKSLLDYTPHANLRWHYFMAWMMLGVKQWMDVFGVES